MQKYEILAIFSQILMIFNVLAIYYRFTKHRTSSTFFEIFVPNLARILLVYVLTKCWKQNFEFGPYFHKKYNSSGLLAIFWPKMSKIWLRVPKNCIFFRNQVQIQNSASNILSTHTLGVFWPSLGQKSRKMQKKFDIL